ncbi:MAG: hypothetical protein C4B58_14860 [Deltaproteobacteria bacterium]|nr:MAG: hypothetical protein C4B58_14860 [Deltaproteobacteria bacterium]
MKIRSTPTIIVNLFLFLLFALTTEVAADSMKIAVATTGPEKDAAISQQAARAPFFLFFNDKGNFLEAVENPSRDRSRNAGPNAALFLADKGVTLVIAGNIGNKMGQALRDDQIEYIEKTGVGYDVVQTTIQDR